MPDSSRRAEFEFVCAICGKSHEESPLDETPLGATEGKTALPLCEDCKADNKKPVLVGKANPTEKAVEKRKEKRIAKDDADVDDEATKVARKAAPKKTPGSAAGIQFNSISKSHGTMTHHSERTRAAGSSTGSSMIGSKRKETPAPPLLEDLVLEVLPALFTRLGEKEEKAITRSVLCKKVHARPQLALGTCSY